MGVGCPESDVSDTHFDKATAAVVLEGFGYLILKQSPLIVDISDDGKGELALVLEMAIGGGAGYSASGGNAAQGKVGKAVDLYFFKSRNDESLSESLGLIIFFHLVSFRVYVNTVIIDCILSQKIRKIKAFLKLPLTNRAKRVIIAP